MAHRRRPPLASQGQPNGGRRRHPHLGEDPPTQGGPLADQLQRGLVTWAGAHISGPLGLDWDALVAFRSDGSSASCSTACGMPLQFVAPSIA
eukprot:5578601-Lingulodinium_polyedra.AAC.1